MGLFNKVTKSFTWGNHQVVMETGEVARQSSGAPSRNVLGMTHRHRWLPGSKRKEPVLGDPDRLFDFIVAYLRRPSFWISAV